MALESTPNQAFLGGDGDDDFAALDSMAFTGTQSQFGMHTVTPSVSSGSSFGAASDHGPTTGGIGRVGDGREGGFAGVSESLFDRIRARTAEQQNQTMSSQASSSSSQPPQPTQPSVQAPAQSSQQSAFASQQQPSSQPAMEFEKDLLGMNGRNNAFNAAGAGAPVSAPVSAPVNNNQNNAAAANYSGGNETTYSFSASAGEDFSQAAPAPHVPQYGPSRDDPYYAAGSHGQQPHPASLQDKATMALAQTGETVKSLFGAGLGGARAIGAMAQNKMAGGGGHQGGGGQRSYNNNFLLREDSLEEGGTNTMHNAVAASRPPPPMGAPAAAVGSEAGVGASGQAYSMFSYGKTFCEDLFGFVMQLPLWGKGIVAVVLLWVVYALFG